MQQYTYHHITSLIFIIILLTIPVLSGCSHSLQGVENQTAEQIFEHGNAYYEQGDYKKALQYFLYVKDNFIRSPYAGVARFYAGESYFARKKYEDAVIEYTSFLSFFPTDPHAAAAQYKLGVSYFKQSRGPERDQTMLQNALKELHDVERNYPENGEYIEKAREAIQEVKNELALYEFLVARFYRKEGYYLSSNQRLTYLLETYPHSNLNGDALFLLGLNYLDVEQPEEAKDQFLQLIQAYPDNEHIAEAQKKLAQFGVSDIPVPAPQPLSSSQPKTPVVLKRDGNLVMTTLVRDDGIQERMVLQVYRGTALIGTIRVLEIHEKFSVAEIESLQPNTTIQENDTVKIP